MNAIGLLRVAVVAVPFITAQAVLAAPCAGFTDVDAASAFCPNVDWLKNRAVTLGCGLPTTYCPNDVVTRLSMAAFMNRLGLALTPAIVYAEASGSAYDLDSPLAAVCPTASIAAATFPRSANAGAVLTAQIAVSAAIVALRIVQSTDNGATWTPLNALPASVGGAPKYVSAAVWKGDIPLAPSTAYQFGLLVGRAAGGGTGDLASWNCQIEVAVVSRTGATSPY
jgi:hypothetical protein